MTATAPPRKPGRYSNPSRTQRVGSTRSCPDGSAGGECRIPAPSAAPRPRLPVTGDLLELRIDKPFRPPDWRYRHALVLLERGAKPTPGDAALSAIHRLLLRLRRPRASRRPLPAKLIPYDTALRIYQGPDEPVRAVLEASLLARRSPDTAGHVLGLAPVVAQAYAAVFFDLQGPHLRAVAARHVSRPHRPPEPALGYVLRVLAVAGGPLVLDDLLHAFGLGHYALTPAYTPQDPVLHDLSRRVMIATMLLPRQPAVSHYVPEINLRYRRLRAAAHDPQRHEAALRKLLTAQLQGARRLFGASVRDNRFLADLLTLDPRQ